jgi:phage terminase small subunit
MAKRKARTRVRQDTPPSPRQQLFVQEYLKDLNAAAAGERAGYAHPNMAGPRLMVNDGVKAAVAAGLARTAEASAATVERLERELQRIALADPRRLYNPDGTLKSVPELDDETTAAIASVEVTEELEGRREARRLTGFTKKVKCWDKRAAIVGLLRRWDLAGRGPLGGATNPIHLTITFIEFADTPTAPEATPGAAGA